ncbi:MAG: hypothetical protein K0S78_5320, partial [Thermomicrobiales bacterium]|nr:hypothetical protein [Thermomicrobiales bacterium]
MIRGVVAARVSGLCPAKSTAADDADGMAGPGCEQSD